MISRSQTGSLAVILIILISTVSSGIIGRRSRALKPTVNTPSSSSASTSTEAANGTISSSFESTVIVLLNETNSTKAEDNDIIYLPYRPSVYPYGANPENDDPDSWLWAVDQIMQEQREEKDLTEFAEELEELYTTESEDYEEEYDEEESSLPSEDYELSVLESEEDE